MAIAAAATFVAVGMYFASGAVSDDPGDPLSAGQAMAGASDLLSASAYISVAANILFAVAAIMIAVVYGSEQNPPQEQSRVGLPGLWLTLVLGTLLILPFDLALPRGLIPLARADPSALVFTTMYDTINFVHSVGLVVFYIGTTALFIHQAHTATRAGHRTGWRVLAGISALAVVVAIGLTIGKPPIYLVPTVFITWLGLLWLGLRLTRSSPAAGHQANLPQRAEAA